MPHLTKSHQLFNNSFIPVLLLCLSLFVTSGALAQQKQDIYRIDKLVIDQSPEVRQQVTAKALETVVIRVTGRSESIEQLVIKQALIQAEQYLTQYRYESTDESITILGEQKPASRLILQFSQTAVQRLVQSANLAIWPEPRPPVLVWLAKQQGNKVLLASDSEELQKLRFAAEDRGLPIVTPLLDLEDRQNLSATRLWAMDENQIALASERYNAGATIAGRVSQDRQKTTIRVVLLQQNQRLYLNASGENVEAATSDLVSQLSRYFADTNAVVINEGSDAPSAFIQIENIDSFTDYANLLAYLNDLTVVANVIVSQLQDNTITVELKYNGRLENLWQTLEQSSQLSLISPLSTDSFNDRQYYRWK